MSTPEQAVRVRARELLAGDTDLAALVHGIFDGVPPRATIPFVSIVECEGSDWGTKDRSGREVRLTLRLAALGSESDHQAMARIEAVAASLRGDGDGWTIVSARTVRTRFGPLRDGRWQGEIILRCRCLQRA